MKTKIGKVVVFIFLLLFVLSMSMACFGQQIKAYKGHEQYIDSLKVALDKNTLAYEQLTFTLKKYGETLNRHELEINKLDHEAFVKQYLKRYVCLKYRTYRNYRRCMCNFYEDK